ncbi:MAG: hypothetical protein R2726_11530 [Acidimicrobiales bacterium]
MTVAAAGGVPAGAIAVSLNVTVTGDRTQLLDGVAQGATAQPTASNLNWVAGRPSQR